MTRPLRVLVYGDFDAGVCDTYRFGALRAPLAACGVELRAWSELAPSRLYLPTALAGDPARAVRERSAAIDLAPVDWADVLVLRRWYATAPACAECDTAPRRDEQLRFHCRSTGHQPADRGLHARVLLDELARRPEVLGDTALVYETDDDLLDPAGPPGIAARLRPERPDVRRMLRLADLVTTTTPVLAARLAAHTRAEVRVVRNALDPRWYPADALPGRDGGLRIAYHGAPIRLRDYDVARPAVDEVAREGDVRRIWLGAGGDARAAAAVDEATPWVDGVQAFAGALAAVRPHIGIAPLYDDRYNRARSELHWLEHALIGAASVVSGLDGGGPYDVVRDGVDALVARTADDWRRHLRALAGSASLRADIAGAARERVQREYSVTSRAPEWAIAYADAAERAGTARRAA